MEVVREDGPWRCIEIPGFLVFTRLPDEYLTTFTRELRDHLAALAVLRAPSNLFRPGATQLPVILRSQPLPTVPGPDRARPELLQPFEDELALIYVAYTSPGLTLRAGPSPVLGTLGTITAQPEGGGAFGQPRVPLPVSAHMLARDHLYRELKRRSPTPPEWLLRGFELLARDLFIKRNQVVVKERIPLPPSMSRSVSVRDLLLHPFPDEADPRRGAAVVQARSFVHWAVVDDEKRREGFWRFARIAAAGKADEAVFLECFGMSFFQVDTELNDIVIENGGRLPAVTLVDEDGPESFATVDVRAPHDEEINGLIENIERMSRTPPKHITPIL